MDFNVDVIISNLYKNAATPYEELVDKLYEPPIIQERGSVIADDAAHNPVQGYNDLTVDSPTEGYYLVGPDGTLVPSDIENNLPSLTGVPLLEDVATINVQAEGDQVKTIINYNVRPQESPTFIV